MTVLEIKPARKHLTSISFDNGETVLLDNDTVYENCIKAKSDLTEEKVKELKEDSDYRRAKSRALWYLDRMPLTEKALYEKLVKAGFSGSASAKVLAKFVELGLIDDCRFAENFAAFCAERNISKREIKQKMYLKGVPREISERVLENLDQSEEDQIKALIATKYKTKITAENGIQKVYAALIRKGFSFSAVRAALKQYSEELEYSEE